MKVTVINPTENKISVSINGHAYEVDAKGTVLVEEVDATYWKEKLHNFLLIDKAEEVKEAPKVKEEVEEKEEKKEVKTK